MLKAFKSKHIVCADKVRSGYLLTKNDLIEDIVDTAPEGYEVVDYSEYSIFPAFVDTHVHVNEPGRTQWEGFETATKAAVAAGIGTLIDMPLNCSPVTVSKKALDIKINELSGKLWTDVGFWGGVIPESLSDLDELMGSGVFGVKSFMIDSGIDEFPPMNQEQMTQAMQILNSYQAPYLLHAEVELNDLEEKVDRTYQSFLNSRPREMEDKAISQLIELLKKINTPIHIVHLSSADSLEQIRAAKESGLKISVETCPHYLLLNAESIEDGKTSFKCCPPIREKENNERLWQAIEEGLIDMIVSDHSPCSPHLKKMQEGDFDQAWGGISSLQFGPSLIWTEFQKRGLSESLFIKLMCEAPAKMIGLESKGKLEKNKKADFVVWDNNLEMKITKEAIYHRHKVTPYEGRELKGGVLKTYLSSQCVYNHSDGPIGPMGNILKRSV